LPNEIASIKKLLHVKENNFQSFRVCLSDSLKNGRKSLQEINTQNIKGVRKRINNAIN
jgi:hypothetical protein